MTFRFSMGISQSNPSSSATNEKKYEVFLNFRGETRYGFTNHLYAALRDKSIETFMDDRLEEGDVIEPNLLKTIRESKISVVIFSKDYASSKWCLRELVEIMECKEKNGQIIIPVFYNVAVSDVRNQEGSFKDGFDQLQKKFNEKLAKDKAAWIDSADVSKQSESCVASFDSREKEFHQEMQKWREALTKASLVKGCDSSVTRPDSEVISKLVRRISKDLMSEYMTLPCDFKGLFGFEERFKQGMSLLCLDNIDIRIIGIWGMGGIGKTTIADAIFHQISDDEYGKCFIQNVRQRLEQCGGLISVLQQEILSKVLNDQDIKLDSLTLPKHIKERLYRRKVFIVLDDVDDFLELHNLAGGLHELALGSRIIITTRRRDILYNCGVNDDCIYEVKGLSNQEALHLFREYAFRQSPPTKDLMEISHEILRAIDGNPLGLKVTGSSLSRSNKQEWESALSRLKKSSKILKVLQISYNGLEDEEKHVFLDIACFYVGEHQDYVEKILGNCSYSLKILVDRSLITISNSKIIQMHDLLQEMGREIVYKESFHNPGSRSRLWTQEDVLDTLKNGDGTNVIRGIFFNMSKMNEEKLSSQAFKKMKNLRFLKFYDSTFYGFPSKVYSSNMHFPNGLSYLSDKLRSLNWLGYPLKALPSNFIPKNLVELNLGHSNLEKLWEDTMQAPNLKWIIIKSCPYLTKVLDLLDTPLLEKIDIQFCFMLGSFPSHVQHFNNLCELTLKNCENLRNFLSNNHFPCLTYLHLSSCLKLTRISKDTMHAPRLKWIILETCPYLIKVSDLLDAPLLEEIYIQNCKNLLGFPSPVHHFNNLRLLNILNCENLQSFPNNIPFPSLVYLNLSGCINLARISDILDAPLLEKINFYNCKSLLDFPSPVQHFNKLSELNLNSCQRLQSFPNNIQFPLLISLDLHGCINLTKISDLLDAPLLKKLDIVNCRSLLSFPSPVQHFNNLCDLSLANCENLQSFSINIIHFPSLTCLNLYRCINLTEFPHISRNIKRLYMRKTAIDEVPSSIENLTELVELDLAECTRLKHISTNICKLKALKELDLKNCSALECFPKILNTMKSLEMLDLSGTAIKELHCSIENLSGLHILRLRECKNLEMLPISIYNLPYLNPLNLSSCSKLENLPGYSLTLSNCGESVATRYPICRLSKCHLCLTNCLNLNKTAVSNIMELQINQHRDLKVKGYGFQAVDLKFCYPGSEVPDWFKCQTDGSSINIQMSGHDCVNGRLIGLAACAVIEFDKCILEGLTVSYRYKCQNDYYSSCLPNFITVVNGYDSYEMLLDSDHVALWYSNTSILRPWESESTSYLFEFFPLVKNPICRVKYCGVCPIYEKHNITLSSIANETYGAGYQDFGASSVKEQCKIRKFSDEAVISGRSNWTTQPHPKRTCS